MAPFYGGVRYNRNNTCFVDLLFAAAMSVPCLFDFCVLFAECGTSMCLVENLIIKFYGFDVLRIDFNFPFVDVICCSLYVSCGEVNVH